MENEFGNKQRKSYNLMRRSMHLTMAILILGVGVVMLWGDKMGNAKLRDFIEDKDPMMRNLFGGLCLIYGSFRLYRGLKKEA